jgi:quaternary ammonium compound-resistance protein SugE
MDGAVMAWVVLIVASCIEPIWVTCLDKSENFKKKGWGIAAVVLVLLCLYLLAYCVGMRDEYGEEYIGPGVAYAVLAGIGATGIVAIGRVLYREKLTPKRMAFVAMIVVGIIGIRLAGGI